MNDLSRAIAATATAMHAAARAAHGIPLLTKAEALAICRELDWSIDPEADDLSPLDTALLKLRAYCDWPACIDRELDEAADADAHSYERQQAERDARAEQDVES